MSSDIDSDKQKYILQGGSVKGRWQGKAKQL
jgi:hypothetical protein